MDRRLLRDVALVCLADSVVGASFGAVTVASGLPLWLPSLLSVAVFAGASQFLFVGILTAGGSVVAAAAAGLLVNLRHVPFGFAVSDALGPALSRRLLGSHVMTDEAVAFALARRAPAARRTAYWACAVPLFVFWNLGTLAGALGGRALHDTRSLGLDAAFPAVLLALIRPALGERRTLAAAVTGAAIALCSAPFLPAGLPVLLALLGVAVTLGSNR